MDVELLETLFRGQVDDTRKPYMVSQELFLAWLEEAQDEAAKRRDLIFDKSSDFCIVPTVAGEASYKVSEKIYAISGAFIGECQLAIVDRFELDRIMPNWRTRVGKPEFLMHYDGYVELSPIPDAEYQLKIEAYRLPLCSVFNGGCLEISPTHHTDLLHWCRHKLSLFPDIDDFMLRATESGERDFIRVFGLPVHGTNKRDQFRNTPHSNKACL